MVKCNGEEYKVGEEVVHKYRGTGTVSILEDHNIDPVTVFVDFEGDIQEVSIGLIRRG